jgi:hypothetical protein
VSALYLRPLAMTPQLYPRHSPRIVCLGDMPSLPDFLDGIGHRVALLPVGCFGKCRAGRCELPAPVRIMP